MRGINEIRLSFSPMQAPNQEEEETGNSVSKIKVKKTQKRRLEFPFKRKTELLSS